MLKKIIDALPYLATALIFGLFVVHPAQALELSYPSFLPIKDTLTIGEITKIIFNASLGVGSLVAVAGIIMIGFQLATSGQTPLKRLAARNHIISIIVGILMLLGAVIFLNFINPQLTTLGFREAPAFPDISVSTISPNIPNTIAPGSQFSKYALGKALDNTDVLIQDMYNSLPDGLIYNGLVTKVKDGLAGCSASACQGITPTPYTPGAYICRSCGKDCTSCGWECQPPSTCVADPCTQSSGGSPEPCAARGTANTLLGETINILNDLRTFWNNEIKPIRAQIQSCVTISGELLNYSLAVPFSDLAKNCTDCAESTDYFCGNTDHTTFRRLTLKIPELLQKEQALIDNINSISNAINACSCSNTQFVCPSSTTCSAGIGTAAGNCENRQGGAYNNYDKSCSPDTWAKLAQLNAFRARLQALGTDANSTASLAYLAEQIDPLGVLAIANYDPATPHNLWLTTCNETKKKSAIHENVYCSSSDFCCPDTATRTDTQTCRNEDFYFCDGASALGVGGGAAGGGGTTGGGGSSGGGNGRPPGNSSAPIAGVVSSNGKNFVLGTTPFRGICISNRGLAHYGAGVGYVQQAGGTEDTQLAAAKAMGVKVIRLFGANNSLTPQQSVDRVRIFLDKAYYQYDMRVIVALTDWFQTGFSPPGDDAYYQSDGSPNIPAVLNPQWFKQGFRQNYLPWVRLITEQIGGGRHPGIFAWQVGNELRNNTLQGGNNEDLVAFMKNMADEIRKQDPYHLIGTGLEKTEQAGLSQDQALDLYNSFDFVGAHSYNGFNDQDLWIAQQQNKPYILDEAGFNAGPNDDRSQNISDDMQKAFTAGTGFYCQWGFMATPTDNGDGDRDRGMDHIFHRDWDTLYQAYQSFAQNIN
ncbi:MAG: hypothetical protein HYV65_01760 [Candidatus Spechtbacteria bacterium]|nr:hypothetical protein [Candidatus Spechtbacteria bacterium]